MPNWCETAIKVKGYKPNVDEFIRILNADYDYRSMEFSHIPHLFRIFHVEEIEYGIIIDKKDNTINLTYVLENKMSSGPSEEFISSLTTLYKDIEIEKLNISDEQKAKLTPTFDYNLEVVDENIKGNPLVMMMISIVLFYAVYFCAFQVSNSITTEKTSKIIETLVTSTSPRNIILGKTLGVGLIGLCQLAAIIITAFISAKTFMDPQLLEMALDTKTLTPMLGIITLIYFALRKDIVRSLALL